VPFGALGPPPHPPVDLLGPSGPSPCVGTAIATPRKPVGLLLQGILGAGGGERGGRGGGGVCYERQLHTLRTRYPHLEARRWQTSLRCVGKSR